MADGRSVQIGVRVTPAEKAMYDEYRSKGVTADMSLTLILQERYSKTKPAAFIRLPTVTVFEDSPDIEEQVVTKVTPDTITVRRALPKGFKPDFKGKK